MKRNRVLAVVLVVGLVLLVACGSTRTHGEAPSRFSQAAAYVGAQILLCSYYVGQFFRAVARLAIR